MRKKQLKIVWLGVFSTAFLFSSCVDNNYDLNKDVDLTITVGGENLALPFGNTEEIFLRKFIKVEDSELLDTLATGEYQLLKKDVIDPANVSVASVTIDGPEVSIAGFRVYPVPAIVPPGYIEEEHDELVDSRGEFKLEKRDMPVEIKSIYSLSLKNAPALATMIFKPTGSTNAAELIDLSGLVMTFPKFIVFEAGQEGLNGNVLTFVGEKLVPSNPNGYVRTLKIKSFDFTDPKYGGKLEVTDDHVLMLAENITLAGIVKILNIDPSKVTEEIQMTPVIDVVNLPVASVVGQVNPDIEIDPTVIELGGLPDFLQDDDVRMDLTNPMIELHVNNPVDLPISLNAVMRGMKDGRQTEKGYVTIGQAHGKTPIIIPPKKESLIILSKLGGTNSGNIINVQVSDLNNLIEIIPDNIDLNIKAEADQSEKHTIELGRDYTVDMSYTVDMPLSFGKDLTIIYKDTLDGWNEDIKDFDIEQINLETTIDNTVPLELELDGYAIDQDGNEIAGITVKLRNNQLIPPCKADGSASVTAVVIEIKQLVEGRMKQMDGIILRVTAKSTQTINNMPLKSNQYLLLKNMKAKVPGGIKIDLN